MFGIAILILIVVAFFYFGAPQDIRERVSRKELLTPPPKTATAQEHAAYKTLVQAAAVASPTLTIGAFCAMEPLVIKVKEGDTFTIQNHDSVPHVIAFEDNAFFSVSPLQARVIDLTGFFKKGAGMYRYRCSDNPNTQTVGIMYVTK